tara:strand:+ start:691 stop:939 length:249 start_codon:yes stop_codon:yes gene_type:complete
MINILEKFFCNCLDNKEEFGNKDKINQPIALLLAIIISQLLLLLTGKYLWNNYLVNALTIVKPIDSIIQLFGISLLARLILS